MLSRIAKKLEDRSKKALVAYVVAGDPSSEFTVKLMHKMVAAGVDVIELGVPFSDPEAEGPVIQRGHERALKTNTSLRDVLAMVSAFREEDDTTPIVLMGYLNPIEIMGYDAFSEKAASAGVDGTIIVNLPPEESGALGPCLEASGIDSVYLLAPTTTDERASYITERSRGFVYYVSLKGTTGAATLDVIDVSLKMNRFRKITELPVIVGFGIKDANSAARVAEISDGVAVGAAIVSLVAQHLDSPEDAYLDITRLLSGMRQAMDA